MCSARSQKGAYSALDVDPSHNRLKLAVVDRRHARRGAARGERVEVVQHRVDHVAALRRRVRRKCVEAAVGGGHGGGGEEGGEEEGLAEKVGVARRQHHGHHTDCRCMLFPGREGGETAPRRGRCAMGRLLESWGRGGAPGERRGRIRMEGCKGGAQNRAPERPPFQPGAATHFLEGCVAETQYQRRLVAREMHHAVEDRAGHKHSPASRRADRGTRRNGACVVDGGVKGRAGNVGARDSLRKNSGDVGYRSCPRCSGGCGCESHLCYKVVIRGRTVEHGRSFVVPLLSSVGVGHRDVAVARGCATARALRVLPSSCSCRV
ncbi:hypothetical protein T484DRAFT_3632400, partial [Baffinella frigidus]